MIGVIFEMANYAWVIEYGKTQSPKYATVANGVLTWTIYNQDALRFSRKKDAEMVAEIMADADRITQHAWDDE